MVFPLLSKSRRIFSNICLRKAAHSENKLQINSDLDKNYERRPAGKKFTASELAGKNHSLVPNVIPGIHAGMSQDYVPRHRCPFRENSRKRNGKPWRGRISYAIKDIYGSANGRVTCTFYRNYFFSVINISNMNINVF